MKLLTYCDPTFKSIGNLTIPIMAMYCEKHNIEFSQHEIITSIHADVYWNKISIVENALHENDWVVWCDADILIQNQNFNLKNYLSQFNDKNLIVSSDFRGICLGFFALRNCQWSKNLFNLMQSLGNIKQEKVGTYDLRNQREQDTLKVLLDFFENISSKTYLIPEDIISNPRSKEINAEVFAHHFWANNKIEQVTREIKSKLSLDE